MIVQILLEEQAGGNSPRFELDAPEAGDVGIDVTQEREEFLVPVAFFALADDLAADDVERGEQRGGAVSDVVMGDAFDIAQPHGQDRLSTVQRLHLGFLIDAQNHGVVRRIEVEPDDVVDLLHEQRVARQFERLTPMRLQPEGAPDPADVDRDEDVCRAVFALGLDALEQGVLAALDPIDLDPGDHEYGAFFGPTSKRFGRAPDYRGPVAFSGFFRKAFFDAPAIGIGLQASKDVQMLSGQTQFVLGNGGRILFDGGVSHSKIAGEGYVGGVSYEHYIDRGGLAGVAVAVGAAGRGVRRRRRGHARLDHGCGIEAVPRAAHAADGVDGGDEPRRRVRSARACPARER